MPPIDLGALKAHTAHQPHPAPHEPRMCLVGCSALRAAAGRKGAQATSRIAAAGRLGVPARLGLVSRILWPLVLHRAGARRGAVCYRDRVVPPLSAALSAAW